MLRVLLIPLALALGATTQGAQAPVAAPPAAPTAAAPRAIAVEDTARVVIDFENQSPDLATIYAVRESGQYARLGQVTPGGKTRIVVPRHVVSTATNIRLVAVPFARRVRPNSGTIAVAPGDHLAAALSSTLNTISVLPARE